MSNLEKHIKMLRSDKSNVRYEACEELRVATDSSPEVILALIEATKDPDAQVAERAIKALDAEVHQQMAIRMGINKPEIQTNAIDQSEPPRSSGETQVNSGKTKVCPYCAETIKHEAIVCKYCYRPLPGHENDVPPMAQVPPRDNTNQQRADTPKASDIEEDWEYCQIQASITRIMHNFTGALEYECYFWGETIGKDGSLCVAKTNNYRLIQHTYFEPAPNPPMGGKSEDQIMVTKLLNDLIVTLQKGGWEIMPDRGISVWSYRFRRKARYV